MSGLQRINYHFIAAIAAWMGIAGISDAQTSSRLSSRFLARGEEALLEVVSVEVPAAQFPLIAEVPGVEIKPIGHRQRMEPGRKIEFVYQYILQSYETGNHTIPSIEVIGRAGRSSTEPIDFAIFNPDDLKWSEAIAGGERFRYASAFRVMNPSPYEGETTPVEIKLYVPEYLNVQDYGIPDFDRDGVTSWRFQPSLMKGTINLLGLPYQCISYPSTLTPTKSGKVAIGPATVRLMTSTIEMDAIQRRMVMETNVLVPKFEINAKPLPPGAPDGFENAVGEFRIETSSDVTTVQVGDPILVKVEVTGSGNLDILRSPKPVNAEGWKIYGATTEQRDDERRELAGRTIFNQFMRPLEMKPDIPAFRLVYFDPKLKEYKTVSTAPIALSMAPAPLPKVEDIPAAKALAVPVERMTDILGVLRPASLTISKDSRFPPWMLHLLGGLLALGLIAKAFWMRNAHRFRKDPVRTERLKALRDIENMRQADASGFLMAAGAYIERWLGGNPEPEVKAVLEERDALCFRPDGKAAASLDPQRRETILRTLRRAAMTILLGGFMCLGESRAADVATLAREAYDSARYEEAIRQWLGAGEYKDLSADTLYNIGNACYRAGAPGHAALYYRRAMQREPGHAEARQNLRFIERKYGSITVHRPDYQFALTKLPLSTWQGMVWGGAWICVLAALLFPATRPGAPVRMAGVVALVAGPLLATCGALGWRYYPNESEFAPVARQAVIVAPKAVLHAEAARTSAEVIDAPPGSICELLSRSGRWAYVAFATKTRGWIPMEALEMVIPEKAPQPPDFRKPKADDKSA